MSGKKKREEMGLYFLLFGCFLYKRKKKRCKQKNIQVIFHISSFIGALLYTVHAEHSEKDREKEKAWSNFQRGTEHVGIKKSQVEEGETDVFTVLKFI